MPHNPQHSQPQTTSNNIKTPLKSIKIDQNRIPSPSFASAPFGTRLALVQPPPWPEKIVAVEM
jgi:hypothetical protein